MRVWEMSHQREKYYKGWPKKRRLEMVMLRPSVMTIYKPITTSQLGEGKVTRMISERIVKGARYSGPWLMFGHQVRCENINNIMPIHKPIVCTWIAVLMLLTRFTMARKSTPAAAANALGWLHWAVGRTRVLMRSIHSRISQTPSKNRSSCFDRWNNSNLFWVIKCTYVDENDAKISTISMALRSPQATILSWRRYFLHIRTLSQIYKEEN